MILWLDALPPLSLVSLNDQLDQVAAEANPQVVVDVSAMCGYCSDRLVVNAMGGAKSIP
ncbi:hypothetical protein [Actinomadura madurae]|uniref:hypothetical protein n=1 Tax=Actinomadura madurae TaxID=1993 RepID=UPI0015A6BCFF|nr:hypothetical protein [Actinomadura madurae]